MKKFLSLMILTTVLLVTGCGGKTGSAGKNLTPREKLSLEAEDSPEWLNKLDQSANADQLFVVAAVGDTTAWISMHEKDKDGSWKMIMSTPGFIGKNGICADADHAEGCAQTPVGTYHFTKAFGIADDPGCKMPYTKVTDDTYWSGDQREGMHYNEIVSIKDHPDLDTENSEHILDYTYQYQYCLNISFNEEGTPGRGSAIFLHCFGDWKPYTGGCVAVPMDQMYYIMTHVSPGCVVVIDTLDNLENGTPGVLSTAADTAEEEDSYDFPEDFLQDQSGKTEFRDYDEIISCLKPGQGYSYIRLKGSDEDLLAVAELVFEADKTAGDISLYGMRDGKPAFFGVISGNGSAYPVRLSDGIIYCGDNHRYETYFLNPDGTGLMQKDYIDDGVNEGSGQFIGFLRNNNDYDHDEEYTGGQEQFDSLINSRESIPAIVFTVK